MNRTVRVRQVHLIVLLTLVVTFIPAIVSAQFFNFADRTSWESANNTLFLEDFETSAVGVGGIVACGALVLNSTTTEACYPGGADTLLPGAEYSIAGLSQFSALLVAGDGRHPGTITDMLGPEYDFDALTIDFNPPVEAAAFSHIQIIRDTDFVVVATDTLGATDSTFYAGGIGSRRFYGVSAAHLISSIHFPGLDHFEFIDSLATGDAKGPDLIVDSIQFEPDTSAASPRANDSVMVRFDIKNIGGTSSGSFDWRFLATTVLSEEGGALVVIMDSTKSGGSLAPGEVWSDSVGFYLNIRPAPMTVKIEADPSSLVLESDETNNLDSLTVLVKPRLLGVKFAGKVILEGAHASGGVMSTGLGAAIPLTDPYWGEETVLSVPPEIVDWVFVQLRRDSLDTEFSDDFRAAFVDSTGRILGVDGDSLFFETAPRVPSYVVVYHRNHLSIMSPDTMSVLPDGGAGWDFTTSMGQAYSNGGDPMKNLGGGYFGMFACDANSDGQVTAPDFNIWNASTTAGETGYRPGDCNLDGIVTAPDFNLWNANTTAGASSQVPD